MCLATLGNQLIINQFLFYLSLHFKDITIFVTFLCKHMSQENLVSRIRASPIRLQVILILGCLLLATVMSDVFRDRDPLKQAWLGNFGDMLALSIDILEEI